MCGRGRRDPFPPRGDARIAPGWSPAAQEQRTRAAWSRAPYHTPPPPCRPDLARASDSFAVEKLAHRGEVVARLSQPVDHERKRGEEPPGCATDAFRVVQVYDGAGMGAAQDVARLLRG